MNDSDRFKLNYGPYVPPKCRIGDNLPCEYRGREVVVGGMTDALIQWPIPETCPPSKPLSGSEVAISE